MTKLLESTRDLALLDTELQTQWCSLEAGLRCYYESKKRTHLYALIAAASGYEPHEVAAWVERVESMDAAHPSMGERTLRRLWEVKLVPNHLIREAVLDHLTQARGTHRSAFNTESMWGPLIERAYRALCRWESLYGVDYKSFALKTDGCSKRTRTVQDNLRDRLGISVNVSKGERSMQIFIEYEKAAALAVAIGIPPVEVGV